jgi:hypothetical protein
VGHIAGDGVGFGASRTPRFPATTSFTGKALAAPDGDPYLYCL